MPRHFRDGRGRLHYTDYDSAPSGVLPGTEQGSTVLTSAGALYTLTTLPSTWEVTDPAGDVLSKSGTFTTGRALASTGTAGAAVTTDVAISGGAVSGVTTLGMSGALTIGATSLSEAQLGQLLADTVTYYNTAGTKTLTAARESTFICDPDAGTITLAMWAGTAGQEVHVHNIGATGSVIIDADGSESVLVNGAGAPAGTYTLAAGNSAILTFTTSPIAAWVGSAWINPAVAASQPSVAAWAIGDSPVTESAGRLRRFAILNSTGGGITYNLVAATVGAERTLTNTGTVAATIDASGAETIAIGDNGAAATLALAAGETAILYCAAAGTWNGCVIAN